MVDSRLTNEGSCVRRRRQCQQCERRFTTYEHYERKPVAILKSDGSRQPFDREKLLRGLVRATNKRPVTTEQLEGLVENIEAQVRAEGSEIDASEIGNLALQGLKGLDEVAYVRFASVYRDFESVEDFSDELERLSLSSGSGKTRSSNLRS